MTSLSVLIADHPGTASAIAAAFRRRGHSITTIARLEEALELPTPDVLVCETQLGGSSGLDLLTALQAIGRYPRTVFVANTPTVDDYRRALRLGAIDLLVKPLRIEELVQAVDRAAPAPIAGPIPGQSSAWHGTDLVRTYPADRGSIETAMRELCAWCVGVGLTPSARARIAGASAEAFENACRHAYLAGHGEFRVRAAMDDDHAVVRIEDDGIGFDPALVAADAFESTRHNGFARAAALAEDVELDSTPGRGSRVTLRFAAYRADFDDGETIDLTELDFLAPADARHVLEKIGERGDGGRFQLSPALAVAIGRLLAGPDPKKRMQLALWS